MSIKDNLEPLDSAATFPYLGCTIVYNNSDWAALYHNVRKYQRRWGMVSSVMVKAVAAVQSQEMMYTAVVQTGMLYNSDSWVITDTMMKLLEVLHRIIARKISRKTACLVEEEGW